MIAHQERTKAFDGTEIAWTAVGRGGSDVVLVHGITESAPTWDPIVRRLSESHRVITLDLRGHGASGLAERYDLEAMAGDVAAVMAAADSSDPHLVGAASPTTSSIGSTTSVEATRRWCWECGR